MALRFSAVVDERKRHLGFDFLPQKEIVCRKGATRILQVPPNEPGLYEFRTQDKKVATIENVTFPKPGTWEVEITGHSPGTTIVEAVRNNVVEDTVKVYVYKQRVVKVNFYRCQDSSGAWPSVLLSDIPDIIQRLNGLFKYQANIILETHVIRSLTLDATMDLRTSNQPVENIVKIFEGFKKLQDKYDSSVAHKNVFLVPRWTAKDRPGATLEDPMRDVFGTTSANCCVVENMPNKDLTVILIGHELAHTLGAEHATNSYPEALMAEKLGGTHLHIYPYQVKQMRGEPVA